MKRINTTNLICVFIAIFSLTMNSACSVKAEADDKHRGSGDANPINDPISGTYKVTNHNEWDSWEDGVENCVGEPKNLSDEFEYFHLEVVEEFLSGNNAVYFTECSSATECGDEGDLGKWYFDTKGDNGWTAFPMKGASDGYNEGCYFSYSASTAVLTEGKLVMDYTSYSGDVPKIRETCMGVLDELFEANFGKLECQTKEVIEAEKVN